MRAVLVVVAMAAVHSTAFSQTSNQELAQLRHDLALNFLEPPPHMALAKYLRARGDRLQAFYVLESARRNRFPRAQFDAAFARAFGTPARNDAGLALFNRGIQLQQAGSLKEAEEAFVKAAELSPTSVHIQSWVGRFLHKVRRKDQAALDYYLNAYLLNPHAYETEFVESRIRSINYEVASSRYRWLYQTGVPLTQILQDPNPTVVVAALDALSRAWSPESLEPVLKSLEHEDEYVRWQAMELISKNVDRAFDPKLRQLLKSDDLRVRGMAAYMAVRLWKQESFPVLRQMLLEPAQLLRFDAISALAMDGGAEGRRILFDYRGRERHPVLLDLIDKARQR